MTSRRQFIGTLAGVAAVGTLAGCLSDTGGDDPESGIDTDDELLQGVANPTEQVAPLYFSGYQFNINELGNLQPQEIIPRIGGSVAGLFDGQLDGATLSDLDQITGSIYNSSSSGGALQVQPFPSGQAVHATGDFDADPLLTVLEESDAQQSFGESNGYQQYMAEIQGGDGFEAWGVSDGRLIIVNRTDVTSRSQEYSTKEETAGDALGIEFDQAESTETPIVESAPAFAETLQSLDPAPIRAGTAYALVPLGSDTGTKAFDDAVRGVVGAGISASVETDQSVTRSVTYLDAEMASADRIKRVYDADNGESVPADSWDFSTKNRTVTARAQLDTTPDAGFLQRALPVPGYQSLFRRINPNDLNRAPTPRVSFQPAIDEGILQITHAGGRDIESLQVRYVHNGSVQQEPWNGPVSEGGMFRSQETIDSETLAWVTWKPETVDAAVLSRFETPA